MNKPLKIIAWMIIFFNFPLAYFTTKLFINNGGPMGFGWLLFPYLIAAHFFIITAIVSLIKKPQEFISSHLIINGLGVIISAILFTFLII